MFDFVVSILKKIIKNSSIGFMWYPAIIITVHVAKPPKINNYH